MLIVVAVMVPGVAGAVAARPQAAVKSLNRRVRMSKFRSWSVSSQFLELRGGNTCITIVTIS